MPTLIRAAKRALLLVRTISSRTEPVRRQELRTDTVHRAHLAKTVKPRRLLLAQQPRIEFAKVAASALQISSKRKNAVEAKTRNAPLARNVELALTASRNAQRQQTRNAKLVPLAPLDNMKCLRAEKLEIVFVPLVQPAKLELIKLCPVLAHKTDGAKRAVLAKRVNIKKARAQPKRTLCANPALRVVMVNSQNLLVLCHKIHNVKHVPLVRVVNTFWQLAVAQRTLPAHLALLVATASTKRRLADQLLTHSVRLALRAKMVSTRLRRAHLQQIASAKLVQLVHLIIGNNQPAVPTRMQFASHVLLAKLANIKLLLAAATRTEFVLLA